MKKQSYPTAQEVEAWLETNPANDPSLLAELKAAQKNTPHGGARPGAGRKKKNDQVRLTVSISKTARQHLETQHQQTKKNLSQMIEELILKN